MYTFGSKCWGINQQNIKQTQAQSRVNLLSYTMVNAYMYISSKHSLLVTINDYQNVLICKETDTKTKT